LLSLSFCCSLFRLFISLFFHLLFFVSSLGSLRLLILGSPSLHCSSSLRSSYCLCFISPTLIVLFLFPSFFFNFILFHFVSDHCLSIYCSLHFTVVLLPLSSTSLLLLTLFPLHLVSLHFCSSIVCSLFLFVAPSFYFVSWAIVPSLYFTCSSYFISLSFSLVLQTSYSFYFCCFISLFWACWYSLYSDSFLFSLSTVLFLI
jgi:hypothetical protein